MEQNKSNAPEKPEQGGEKMYSIEETINGLKENIRETEEAIAADERVGGKKAPEQIMELNEKKQKLIKLKKELSDVAEETEKAIDNL